MIDTINHLIYQAGRTEGFLELILVDQTKLHEPSVENQLTEWEAQGTIKWLRCSLPHITRSMNYGLFQAKGDIVLFTDDDIIPKFGLLENHLRAYRKHPQLWAVVGQILQPGEQPEVIPYEASGKHLFRFLDFPFRRTEGAFIENAMGGNLSVVREKAISIGGFDENFIPPVSSRFETEFAKRIIKNGGTIWFEPRAGIHHLQADLGGTRSKGGHLNSSSPRYGVGDCYYALITGNGYDRFWYIISRPFRRLKAKYHLSHPWWVPLKFFGEIFAIIIAIGLFRKGPALATHQKRDSSECVNENETRSVKI